MAFAFLRYFVHFSLSKSYLRRELKSWYKIKSSEMAKLFLTGIVSGIYNLVFNRSEKRQIMYSKPSLSLGQLGRKYWYYSILLPFIQLRQMLKNVAILHGCRSYNDRWSPYEFGETNTRVDKPCDLAITDICSTTRFKVQPSLANSSVLRTQRLRNAQHPYNFYCEIVLPKYKWG